MAEPSPKELLERLSAHNDCLKVCEALRVATRALAWYADERHWKEDDWNVPAVVQSPEYGDPGKKARNAIRRIDRLLAPGRVAAALRDEAE